MGRSEAFCKHKQSLSTPCQAVLWHCWDTASGSRRPSLIKLNPSPLPQATHAFILNCSWRGTANAATPLLGIHSKTKSRDESRCLYTQITAAKRWEQPKCSLMNEWPNKVYTYIQQNMIMLQHVQILKTLY